MKTIGLISANYSSTEFGDLLDNRSLASLPYGGRYRLIDFENMLTYGYQRGNIGRKDKLVI